MMVVFNLAPKTFATAKVLLFFDIDKKNTEKATLNVAFSDFRLPMQYLCKSSSLLLYYFASWPVNV